MVRATLRSSSACVASLPSARSRSARSRSFATLSSVSAIRSATLIRSKEACHILRTPHFGSDESYRSGAGRSRHPVSRCTRSRALNAPLKVVKSEGAGLSAYCSCTTGHSAPCAVPPQPRVPQLAVCQLHATMRDDVECARASTL